MWEVFFLVHVGRGVSTGAISPAQHEDVCHFLYDASQHGFVVRTVEAPFFRRVVARAAGRRPGPGHRPLYRRLAGRLDRTARPAVRGRRARIPRRPGTARASCSSRTTVRSTRRAFCPLGLGNVRDRPLREIYTG